MHVMYSVAGEMYMRGPDTCTAYDVVMFRYCMVCQCQTRTKKFV